MMTKRQAMAEAVRRWGKQAMIRDSGRRAATTPEQRAEARAKLTELNKLPKEERYARKKERDELFAVFMRHRYNVGRVAMGLFFCILGEGDTWEEAFKNAEGRS